MEDTKHLSFNEQIRRLLDENLDKYPDAVRWMMDHFSSDPTVAGRKTEYERFIDRLTGKTTWHEVLARANQKYPPKLGPGWQGQLSDSNKVERIKYLRSAVQRVGSQDRILGLKEAKDLVEYFADNNMTEFERIAARLPQDIEVKEN